MSLSSIPAPRAATEERRAPVLQAVLGDNRWHDDDATATRVCLAVAVRAMGRLFRSQQALAIASGTKQRSISAAARGEHEPPWSFCHRLWRAVRTRHPHAAPLNTVVARLCGQARAPGFRANPPPVQLADLEAAALAMLYHAPPEQEAPCPPPGR